MRDDDQDQVVSLLTNSFFRDEPIARCLQLTDTLEFVTDTVKHCVQDGCSFVAYDTQTNRIVGACLNEIERRDPRQGSKKSYGGVDFIMELFVHMQAKETIFDRMKCDVLLHIFVLSVDQVARGHGLAARLIAKSIEQGKELHLPGAYSEASNFFSLRCFQQNHFNIVDEVKYTDYNPERLATMIHPHYDRCYLLSLKF